MKSAFCIIPLQPRDFDLLCLELLPSNGFVCLRVNNFTSLQLQASTVMLILDDLVLAPLRDKCHRDLENFIKLCNEVGVPITDEKTVGPATCLQFARINLDTITMQPRLPEDKLAHCSGLLTEFYKKRSVTLTKKKFLSG